MKFIATAAVRRTAMKTATKFKSEYGLIAKSLLGVNGETKVAELKDEMKVCNPNRGLALGNP